MKKTLLITALTGLFLGAAIAPCTAAPISAPPQISEADAQSAQGNVNSDRRSGSYEKFSEKARKYEVNPDLAPTDADYAKARKDREEGRVAKRSQRTEIEATTVPTPTPVTVKIRSEHLNSSISGSRACRVTSRVFLHPSSGSVRA